jgi:CDP-diacylglycerol--serine O-phosphatidyltransferase
LDNILFILIIEQNKNILKRMSSQKFPKLLKLKDYITLTGTILGVIALICASIGTRYFISFGFFLVTLTLGTDLLDGYVARKTGTVNKIGIELDSLSDALTFGIAPAVLTFQAFKTGTSYDIFLIIGCVCLSLGGILRLARFNITTEEIPGYTGVPIPISALLLIIFFYTNYFYAFAYGGLDHPFPDVSYFIIPFILILIGWFNITTFVTFGKKGKNIYVLFFILASITIIIGILWFLSPTFSVLLIISYILLGSFLTFMIYLIRGFFSHEKKPSIEKTD